ncbi:hypothetical protein [Paracoccus contaminans]|uniref:Uncharacterized protein n=1 Tax=Paracoccus contaminans TaxID=1945662 RepID=A0A1W6CW39_9RHOB|nr:hypothetical protein [Paracoccus contaminans]ARJ69103.1 hypothetical protein B0A89_05155 [Paracoccus contaminans]
MSDVINRDARAVEAAAPEAWAAEAEDHRRAIDSRLATLCSPFLVRVPAPGQAMTSIADEQDRKTGQLFEAAFRGVALLQRCDAVQTAPLGRVSRLRHYRAALDEALGALWFDAQPVAAYARSVLPARPPGSV